MPRTTLFLVALLVCTTVMHPSSSTRAVQGSPLKAYLGYVKLARLVGQAEGVDRDSGYALGGAHPLVVNLDLLAAEVLREAPDIGLLLLGEVPTKKPLWWLPEGSDGQRRYAADVVALLLEDRLGSKYHVQILSGRTGKEGEARIEAESGRSLGGGDMVGEANLWIALCAKSHCESSDRIGFTSQSQPKKKSLKGCAGALFEDGRVALVGCDLGTKFEEKQEDVKWIDMTFPEVGGQNVLIIGDVNSRLCMKTREWLEFVNSRSTEARTTHQLSGEMIQRFTQMEDGLSRFDSLSDDFVGKQLSIKEEEPISARFAFTGSNFYDAFTYKKACQHRGPEQFYKFCLEQCGMQGDVSHDRKENCNKFCQTRGLKDSSSSLTCFQAGWLDRVGWLRSQADRIRIQGANQKQKIDHGNGTCVGDHSMISTIVDISPA